MAGEASEIKLEDETWSPEPNENDFARTTASNCPPSEGSEFQLAGGEITVREGFIAAPEQLVQEQFTVSVELPEPAVGAEVDCEARSFKSEENAINTPACNTRSPAPGRGGRRRTMRPEDKNCSGCKIHFERHGRSFNRRAVYTFTTPETVHWAFPDATVHEKSFLCETCAQFIRSKCKRKQSGKRCLWLKPVASKQTETEGRRMNDRRMGKKSKAALLVSKSCYKAAFKLLWSAKGARKPMLDFWSKQLKEEMKALVRQPDNPFHQKVSEQKPLSSFPWRRCLKWAQLKAPLVTTCLTSLFPNISALSRSSHSPLTEEQAQVLLERRTVVALSIPLFTRNIWKSNFLQASLGAELRLQGCSGSALDALNTMGLCQNKDTVRLLLHRLQNSQKSTDDGQQSVKGKEDDLKGDAGSDVEEEEERGDVEDQEEELNSTEEEEEIQDDVDQEDQVLDEDAEMEQTLKETVKRQRKETSKQEARREEEEEPKRRRVVVSEMGDGTTHDHAMGEKSKAALLVSKSCYKAAFKLLWSAKGARKPMLDFWSKQLKEEMKALVRQPDNPFHQKVSEQKPLSSFPWRRCLKWAQLKAPLVTTCLTSLFPNISALSRSSHSPLTEEQAQVLLERRTVVALSIPLFTRNIWKNNFLQASLGAELRLQGCSGSALDALNTMGLCQNKDTVRLLLHRLQKSTDDGQQSVKGKEDDLKGDAGSDVEEEEERGDVEDQEEELNSTEEEEEIQDDVDQEDQVLDEDAEMEQTLKETVKRQRKETSKQEARREEEEEPKRRRVVVVRMDLLKGHSEVGRSDLSAP